MLIREVRGLKQKNDSGTIFKLYALRHFTFKPTKHLVLNSRVDFKLLDGIWVTVVTLPSVIRARLKCYIKTDLAKKGIAQFSLNNETFTRTFILKKLDSIGEFTILHKKDNKIFGVEYSQKSKRCIRKRR